MADDLVEFTFHCAVPAEQWERWAVGWRNVGMDPLAVMEDHLAATVEAVLVRGEDLTPLVTKIEEGAVDG